MSRGTTLVKLLDDLRAECRISLNPAHNRQQRDVQVKMLQRKQEWLWNDFAWPHLRVERFIDLQAGQRYYDMPDDLDLERISKIEARQDSVYLPLEWGIGAHQYALYDSELGVRASPQERVQITEDSQLEIWPIPDADFDPVSLERRIKVTGIRKLAPLVDDGDRADLDDQLIVLHCAAEYLAQTGAQDAQIKLDRAQALYLRLRSQLMPKRVFRMFGEKDQRYRPRYPIAIYNK